MFTLVSLVSSHSPETGQLETRWVVGMNVSDCLKGYFPSSSQVKCLLGQFPVFCEILTRKEEIMINSTSTLIYWFSIVWVKVVKDLLLKSWSCLCMQTSAAGRPGGGWEGCHGDCPSRRGVSSSNRGKPHLGDCPQRARPAAGEALPQRSNESGLLVTSDLRGPRDLQTTSRQEGNQR